MTSDAQPPAVTCPHYDPLPGVRRCRHYLPNGACERPDELMCVEWLKANGSTEAVAAPAGAPSSPALPAPPAAEGAPAGGTYYLAWRNAFGEGPARPPPSPRLPPPRHDPPAPPPRSASPAPLASADDVEALATRCHEVRLETEDLGSLWLVAEPSGSGRPELTFRDAAALAAVCAAFPGARVTRLEWAKKST